MAIHSVVTLGYSVAGGYQGGTATLPTVGYDSGEVLVPDAEGLQAASPGRPLHARESERLIQGASPNRQLHARSEGE